MDLQISVNAGLKMPFLFHILNLVGYLSNLGGAKLSQSSTAVNGNTQEPDKQPFVKMDRPVLAVTEIGTVRSIIFSPAVFVTEI